MESNQKMASCCHDNLPLFLIITLLCLQIIGACDIHSRESYLSVEGYDRKFVSYNVCVDNTTIHSQDPTRTYPPSYIFVRRCCGCRVSGAYPKQIELSTRGWPSERHSFYFADIRRCECIECDFTEYAHHRFLRELRV